MLALAETSGQEFLGVEASDPIRIIEDNPSPNPEGGGGEEMDGQQPPIKDLGAMIFKGRALPAPKRAPSGSGTALGSSASVPSGSSDAAGASSFSRKKSAQGPH